MKNYYINLYPAMNDFLKLLDIPFENNLKNGSVAYQIKNYNNEKITGKDLRELMISSYFGVFGGTGFLPHMVEKMNINVVKHNNNHFVTFKLAPLLGLPNNDWKEELRELKSFLKWIKEESIKNPNNVIKLSLTRESNNVKFNLISDSDILEKELNQKMDVKVASSQVLTQWVKNQKEGFKEIQKECNDLFISMNSLSLMSLDEQTKVLEAQNNKTIKKLKI